MAGTRFVVNQFYEANKGLPAGWTESYYLGASSLSQALAVATNGAVLFPRLALLSNYYSLVGIRVSDIDVLRDSLPFVPAGGEAVGGYVGTDADDPAEQPYDGLLIRMDDGGSHRRSFIMRGLPTNIVTKTRSYAPEAEWTTAFAVWANSVTTPGGHAPNPNIWQIRTQVRNPTPVIPASVNVAANNRSLVITFTGAVPAAITQANPFFILAGVTGADHCNKIWRAQFPVGATVMNTYPGRRVIYGTPGGLPLVTPLTYAFSGIESVIPLRGVKRDTGRPFDLLVGKSRGQRS